MAQARVAAGAVFGTITDTANAISGVVNTISNGLDMANSFVRHAQQKQRFDQVIDMAVYQERRVEEFALEEASRKKIIADQCLDPEIQTYYNDSYTKLQALLQPKQA